MKKVLIIAYHFPPEKVVGALRPMGIARYLPEFGWQPIILTAKLPNNSREDLKQSMRIVEIPPFDIFFYLKDKIGISDNKKSEQYKNGKSNKENKIKKHLKHYIKTVLAFPDRNNGWIRNAEKTADKIISEETIDCTLSTSSPWTTALVARKLKLKYGIPWVADFRDLWTQYHRYSYCAARKYLEAKLEKWTLKESDHLNMVSDIRAKKWERLHKGKKISAITLGYDHEDFKNIQARNQKDIFILTHAGNVKEKHNPEPLFKAVGELISEGKIKREKIRINFWGLIPLRVRNAVTQNKLDNVVHMYDLVPRKEVIPELLSSHLLILLNWNDPDEAGIHPGKLFDYLGAKVPILAIGEYKDVVTKVLEETQAGVHLTEYKGLKTYLEKTYNTFIEQKAVPYRGKSKEIEKYSYRNIAAKFARILDSEVSEYSNS